MSSSVIFKIRIMPYTKKMLVHDVCLALYAAAMIANTLSKRFFKISVLELMRRGVHAIKWGFWIVVVSVWIYLILAEQFRW